MCVFDPFPIIFLFHVYIEDSIVGSKHEFPLVMHVASYVNNNVIQSFKCLLLSDVW